MPGEISIVLGALLREKLKSGGANVGGVVVVVLELTELDVVEEVAAVLEDAVVLEGVVVLEEDVVLLDVDVVLTEETFCPGLG
jgi:hypothetical protein